MINHAFSLDVPKQGCFQECLDLFIPLLQQISLRQVATDQLFLDEIFGWSWRLNFL